MHSDFKTVTEIDVHDLSTTPSKHQVGWMAVTQTQDVPDHAVDR